MQNARCTQVVRSGALAVQAVSWRLLYDKWALLGGTQQTPQQDMLKEAQLNATMSIFMVCVDAKFEHCAVSSETIAPQLPLPALTLYHILRVERNLHAHKFGFLAHYQTTQCGDGNKHTTDIQIGSFKLQCTHIC